MTKTFDEATLVRQYTPVLVLFPEITPGVLRSTQPGYPQVSPLAYDYHPRDIRMVLDYSGFHSGWLFWRRTTKQVGWQEMLRRTELSRYSRNLNVLPKVGRLDRAGFWAAYGEILKNSPEYQRVCYARVVHGEGVNSNSVLVQYWYAYFYNDFWNAHEMDWEVVMMVFKLEESEPRSVACVASAHTAGHWLPWSEVTKADESLDLAVDGTHPVIYVGAGSHANYFHGPGIHKTAPPGFAETVRTGTGLIANIASRLGIAPLARLFKDRLNRTMLDYTTAWSPANRFLVEAQLIPPPQDGKWIGDWRWLNHQGRWGTPGVFSRYDLGDAGPYGPTYKGNIRWHNPFVWIDTQCSPAPPRRDSEQPTRLEL